MDTLSIAELKQRADIREVWAALGGGELRHGRGQAFWRGGDGYNVALDAGKGVWFDHRDNVGGDVVALVQTVRGCDFREACAWLADFTGMGASELSVRTDIRSELSDWAADLRWATFWKFAAEALAEECLERLPSWSPDRYPLTELLRVLRLGESSLIAEFRAWRKHSPQLTAAMAHAGRRHDARTQRRLAMWLRKFSDGQ